MDFEWDAQKNETNARRHGLSFDRAARVFLDPFRAFTIDDREAYGEERLTMYGQVEGILLAVTYTMRGNAVRIISARKATRRERKRYEDGEV